MNEPERVLMELYQGNDKAYGLETEDGPKSVREPVTLKLIREHLDGEKRVGTYLLKEDSTVCRALFDIDYGEDKFYKNEAEAQGAISILIAASIEYDLYPYPETSKRRGYHVNVFFDDSIPARDIRLLMNHILKETGVKAEVFPKQDFLPPPDEKGNNGLGNFAYLPLHGNSILDGRTVFIDSQFKSYEDQSAFIKKVHRTKVENVLSWVEKNKLNSQDNPPPPPYVHSDKLERIRACGFLQHCDKDRATLSEPEWYAMLSILPREPGGITLAHELSKGYPGYTFAETEKKIRHALNDSGPATCEHIKELYDCGQDCGVKSPIALAYKNKDNMDSKEPEEILPNPDPPFPREAIGGIAGKFADIYSSQLESPWSFFAFSFLTFLGLIVSDKIKLLTQTKPQTRLFTILIGVTGRGRKSEALSQVLDFFDSFKYFKKCGGVGSAEGLIHWAQDNFAADTIRRAIIVYDEFEAFVQKVKIESSTLSSAIRTLFRRNEYENHTKGVKAGRVENLYLAILGACTQEVFQTMWETDHISGGTLNRFWLVKENSDKIIPITKPISAQEIYVIKNEISRMINSLHAEQVFSIDEDARNLYSEWYRENAKDVSDFSVRLEEYAERLMLLLAFNRDQKKVDLKTVQDTITLIRWQRQVREDCFPSIAVGIKARVEARIRKQVNKHATTGITEGQVNHYIKSYTFDTWIIEQAYKGLERAGHIIKKQGRYYPGPNAPENH